MTIVQMGRIQATEAGDRNATALMLPTDGTQLGVVEGVQAGMTLTKTSGMGWQLDLGRCVIAPATAANGPVVAAITVAETGSFAAGDATRDRIDIVALQIDETATTANGNPPVKSVVIQGAYPASGSPVAPAIPPGAIGLAQVKIAAGTSAGGGGWNTANLTDIRPNLMLGIVKPIGHLGRTGAFQNGFSASSQSAVQFSAAQVLHGGFTFDAATNSLVVPVPGLYRITVQGMFTGNAGNVNIAVATKNGSGNNVGAPGSGPKPDGNDVRYTGTAVVQLAAGDKIGMVQQSAASAWGTTGYDGSFVEVEYSSAI